MSTWTRVWFLESWHRDKTRRRSKAGCCVCLRANILSPGFSVHLLRFISLCIEPESSKLNLFSKCSVPHTQGSLTPQPGPAEWLADLFPVVFIFWFLLWLSRVTSSHPKVYANWRLTLVNQDLKWFFFITGLWQSEEWLTGFSKPPDFWETDCTLLSELNLMNWGMPCNLTAYYVKRQQII